MQSRSTRRSNEDRRRETREALLAAARTCFVNKGFAATGTPELVAAAGMTRGALYHHFADKTDLFRAVIQAEAEAVAAAIRAAAPAEMPVPEALLAGADAYFSAMGAPGRARLLLVEAPAVLGPAEVAALDARTGGATLQEALTALHLAAPIPQTAQLLSAMFDRAALAVAEGADPAPYRAALRHLLEALARPQVGTFPDSGAPGTATPSN
ncbi:TetR/AcrR family transcriptional regulator [Vannielia litorea]|uniref:Transcriptional regulator, TetR family n=1 Tax=Vannielia litorea TaxID=1217970 RepID=A0A1N6H1P3_9RHOB|nr:TetR/AcrR family transcriptional regulator [Vannielia litorea]SIO13714.1 transcriptional regulator, TetR family [Vannielia litorea]